MADNQFKSTFIGTVLDYDKDTREIAVYIPKLMTTMYSDVATSYKVPTNKELDHKFKNKTISATVAKTNYIWIKAKDKEAGIPDIGSKVFIEFLDGRPSAPIWKKCNINGDYTIIEDERYPKLSELLVGDAKVTVNKDDLTQIVLPDYYKTTSEVNKETRTKYINVYENFNFYKNGKIEESISNLQKSMEYLEEIYNSTFIDTLKAITIDVTPSQAITFASPIEQHNITDDDGWSRDQIKRELDKIVDDHITDYPLNYRNEIINKINDTKYSLERVEDENRAKYWQIVRQFYEWLSERDFTLSEFITNSFTKTKQKCITQIKSSTNLLDSSKIFTSYNTFLQGLKDTYTLYSLYITKYKLISDQTTLDNLATQNITEDIINNNILIAFERAYDTIDINNMSAYIEYIKTLFPTQVKITYVYSTDGLVNELETINTNKLFQLNDSTVYEPTETIMPTDIEAPDVTIVSGSTIYDWYESVENISITNNYYLTHDIQATPIYLFAAVVYDYNEDKFKLLTYDNIPWENKTYTYTMDTYDTLADIEDEINDMSYSYTSPITITLTNDDDNTMTCTVELSLDGIDSFNDRLTYISDSLSDRVDTYLNNTDESVYDITTIEDIYNTYLNILNTLSDKGMSSADIESFKEYTGCVKLVNTVKAELSDYINNLINDIPTSTYEPEYDSILGEISVYVNKYSTIETATGDDAWRNDFITYEDGNKAKLESLYNGMQSANSGE